MTEHINAAEIPGENLDPDAIETAAGKMRTLGTDFSTQGGTVLTAWQKISNHYEAPESETLFSVMDPVKTNAETFGSGLISVASALETFAAEARTIKADLAAIKADAQTFIDTTVANGVEYKVGGRGNRGGTTRTKEWHEDQDSIDENNALIGRVNDQMVKLWEAERECANKIYDIIDYPHIEAATESNPNGYGVDEIPDGTDMPWGASVEKTESCGEKTVEGIGTFVWDGLIVGGLWGTVEGLGSLILGYNPETHEFVSGDVYGAAWSNLGFLAVGLVGAAVPTAPMSDLPGPVGDFFRKGDEALLNTGKAIIAYDTWAENPAEAAGTAVFNVGTIFLPAGAAVSGVKAGGSAAAAAIRTAAKVVDFIDPASLVVRGGIATAKITLPALKTVLDSLNFSKLADLPEIDIPPVEVPTLRPDDVDLTTPTDAYETPPVRTEEPALVGANTEVPAASDGTTVDTGGSSLDPGGPGGPHDPTGSGGYGDAGGGGSWDPDMGDPALSDADYGPGFQRDPGLRGDPINPTYGDPLPNHGTLDPNYGPPALDDIPPQVRDLVTDPNAPYGRGADGQPYTKEEWEARYIGPNDRPIYPGNDGAVAGRRVDFDDMTEFQAHYGNLLDRMGADSGNFMAFPDTPFEARALPGSSLSAPYSMLELSDNLPPGYKVEVSEVTPAFGQPGGGLQVRILDETGAAQSVTQLEKAGILQHVDPNTPLTPHYSEGVHGTGPDGWVNDTDPVDAIDPVDPATPSGGPAANNPPHTGLFDPPANHGPVGGSLPDLSTVNDQFRFGGDGPVDPARLNEWADAVSDAYPTITSDGVLGVYDYTGPNYQAMNPYLRDFDTLSDVQRDALNTDADSIADLTDAQRLAVEESIQRADEGLAALPPYRVDPSDATATTWRGMSASDELLDQLHVGDTFIDDGFLSTSTDEAGSVGWAGSASPGKTPTVLTITGRSGVDVMPLSRFMEEAEILFPRGTPFDVVSRVLGPDGILRIELRETDR